jgi:IS5 family transposase
MAWKNIAQRDIADLFTPTHHALEELDTVQALIDWQAVERHLLDIHNKAQGQASYPPLMMFKVMLLQKWYTLSDPKMEKQLARDLLFRRFAGLGLSAEIPDYSSICRFRNLLTEKGLWDVLLGETNAQLAQRDVIIKSGETGIIDATVIEAHQCRPRKNAKGGNTQDQDAGYSVKRAANGKQTSTYGYKAHVNVEEDGFIKTVAYTAGNVHDSQVFEELLTGDETAVYGDKAYPREKLAPLLDGRGIENCLLFKAKRNKPLTDAQKQQNKIWSATRATVERTFGLLKLHFGAAKARYLGLKRNHAHFTLMSIAYNLKRATPIWGAMA